MCIQTDTVSPDGTSSLNIEGWDDRESLSGGGTVQRQTVGDGSRSGTRGRSCDLQAFRVTTLREAKTSVEFQGETDREEAF